jgi:hypothetical protein
MRHAGSKTARFGQLSDRAHAIRSTSTRPPRLAALGCFVALGAEVSMTDRLRASVVGARGRGVEVWLDRRKNGRLALAENLRKSPVPLSYKLGALPSGAGDTQRPRRASLGYGPPCILAPAQGVNSESD